MTNIPKQHNCKNKLQCKEDILIITNDFCELPKKANEREAFMPNMAAQPLATRHSNTSYWGPFLTSVLNIVAWDTLQQWQHLLLPA